MVEGNVFKIGFQNAMSKKYIKVDKGMVVRCEGNIVDEDRALLIGVVE